jgi:hypothetical protein
MVIQPGLAVRPQGMDWDYGHTAWFSSTASGNGLGVHSATGHRVGNAGTEYGWEYIQPQGMM